MAAITWKSICCPVNSSEPAHSALRVAADLSHRLGSELVLLHVDAVSKIAEELPPRESVEAQLAALKMEAERLGAPRVIVERVRGQPEIAIVEYAKRGGVDLLVLGTHGRTDRQAMLTGSVAEGVVRNAGCPVLTVHAEWRR